jgi:Zn-finger nucleic acid-binding protein
MSQKSEVEMHECQNCGKRWPLEKLKEVKHLLERVLPGEPMPSGECPECGAVCHPVKPT